MIEAPKPKNEKERLEALESLQVLDTPINPVFERITRITKNFFGVPIVAISIIDSERQWFKSTQGLNVCQNDLNTSFCAHAILQDDIFIVLDPLSDERFKDNPLVIGDPNIRFYAGCPVQIEGGFNIGTLCIIDSKPHTLDEDQLNMLRDMAGLVREELRNYHQKYSQLQIIKALDKATRAKLIDNLTGVWNRGGIEINLQENITLAQQQNYELLVGIYDIDNFKHINDTYGHNAGDAVIRDICKTIVMNLEDDDIIGRWGGEEFVIISKIKDNVKSTQLKIDNARAQIASNPVVYEDIEINVSVTIGLTVVKPNNKESILKVIERADRALYQGKGSGKNKCVLN